MEILKFFEKNRTPFWDNFFSAVTYLGWETLFLVVALVMIWCVNKKYGFFILYCGLIGQCISQLLKILCQVQRPWIAYPDFQPVKSAVDEAAGYSFPSGHTQIATTTYGGLAFLYRRKKCLCALLIIVVALVALSRVYLGVHYPSDVLFSLLFNTALVLVFYYIGAKYSSDKMSHVLRALALILMGALFVYTLIEASADILLPVIEESMEFTSKMFGATLAFVISWWIDEKYLNFETHAPFKIQLFKTLVGIIILLLIKEGCKWLFLSIGFNEIAANTVRYFLIVIFAGTIWPYAFTRAVKNK